MKNFETIYKKKKRRVLGELMKGGEITSSNAWLSIHKSSKEELITYESQGLVVAVNGSGTLPLDHFQCREAEILAKYISDSGGIVINGGRNKGILAAAARGAGDNHAGIIFPEIEQEANKNGIKVMVNSPQPRIEILGTCPPIIVIFRGGLGTLMMLMRSIVHIKNRAYHPEQLPQIVFVSNYWIGLLSTMMNIGTLPKEFISELTFFNNAKDIIEKMPKLG